MKTRDKNLNEKMQVMLQWKKSYLEALIDELQPFGDVLEIGFGHGYAADRIQTFKPKSHTIIEADPERLLEARAWAKKHSNITIIESTWQNKLPTLGIFDTLFFNDDLIDSDRGMICRIHPEKIAQSSSQAKELLSKFEEQIPQLSANYTDQDIDDFYQKIGQYNLKELFDFFGKLKEYGFITEKQYQQTLKKYHLEPDESPKKQVINQGDTSFVFLEDCLKNHMRKRSRFSCFSKDVTSKYEDSQFFDHVITNPYIDYHEKVIPIKVPHFSDYYKFDEALIMVVEKFS